MRFNEKTVLVTGAARGSGEAIAKRFLKEGAFVVATDIVKPTWDAGSYSEKVLMLEFDVSDEDAVNEAFEDVKKQVGGVNILVNNAGISPEADVKDTELNMWEKIFAVNSRGTFLCTKAAVNIMLDLGLEGRIINISSIAARKGFPKLSAYCASKAAVIGFTRSLAEELGEYGITVNAICPGSVETDMIKDVIKNLSKNTGMNLEETRKMMTEGIPLKRFQTPEDVAAMVTFLASEDGRNVNGEVINLDGGAVRS